MVETIKDFMDSFVNGEHDLNVIFYSERDDERVKTKRKTMLEYFLPGLTEALMNQFYTKRSDEWLEQNREAVKYLKPRTIFMTDELDCPDVGKIFRCQLGQNSTKFKEQPSYHFFVAEYEDRLRIAAYFHICGFCSGTGILKDKKCPECYYGLRVHDQLGTTRKHFPPAAVELYDNVLKFVKKNLKDTFSKCHPKA